MSGPNYMVSLGYDTTLLQTCGKAKYNMSIDNNKDNLHSRVLDKINSPVD